jgi:hypothetical protein
MSKREKTEAFMFTPLIFNLPNIKEEVYGAYTISIPLSEMKKFETEEELNNFLFYHYNELFYVKEPEIEEARIQFYYDKIFEKKLLKEDKENE